MARPLQVHHAKQRLVLNRTPLKDGDRIRLRDLDLSYTRNLFFLHSFSYKGKAFAVPFRYLGKSVTMLELLCRAGMCDQPDVPKDAALYAALDHIWLSWDASF